VKISTDIGKLILVPCAIPTTAHGAESSIVVARACIRHGFHMFMFVSGRLDTWAPATVPRAVSHIHMGPASPQTSLASRRGGRGGGCPAKAVRRRHRGEAAENKEEDVTSDLLLKHLDAILATHVWRAEGRWNTLNMHLKHLQKHMKNTWKRL
jgi:hypothetical protein